MALGRGGGEEGGAVGLAWAKLKLILKIDFYRDLQSSWPFLNAAVDMRVA